MTVLVEMAMEKNYKKTCVWKAMDMLWQERQPSNDEKKLLQPTEKEKIFWEKVDNFIQKYRENILGAFKIDYSFTKTPQEYFLENSFKPILYVAYVVFEREDNITYNLVIKYAKKLFDQKLRIGYGFGLHSLFERMEIPKENQTGILSFEDFCRTFQYFRYRRYGFKENMLKLIWFIDTYC